MDRRFHWKHIFRMKQLRETTITKVKMNYSFETVPFEKNEGLSPAFFSIYKTEKLQTYTVIIYRYTQNAFEIRKKKSPQ